MVLYDIGHIEGLIYSYEFWLDYAIVWIFQRIESEVDATLQILIFEMFYYLILKELNIRVYSTTEIKALNAE